MSDAEPRMCIVIAKTTASTQVSCYGNCAALLKLANRLRAIAATSPTEMFHTHVIDDLSNDATRFEDTERPNVWVASQSEGDIAALWADEDLPDDWTPLPFDLQFMHVTEKQLDEMLPKPPAKPPIP